MRYFLAVLLAIPLVSLSQSYDSPLDPGIKPYNYIRDMKFDTLYYPDKKIKAIGKYVRCEDHIVGWTRIGYWKEFYGNGQIKSIGEYQTARPISSIDLFIPFKTMTYKVGYWTYFYENGQMKAVGKYQKKNEINSSMIESFSNSFFIKDWLAFDIKGMEVKDKYKIILELDSDIN
ncbi:MAG: hypothetical protein ABI480_02150 [Chitinophagaceae bacterium]